MQVYYFMLIWVIICGSILHMTKNPLCSNEDIYENKINWGISIITFLPIIIFAGLRSYGVADTSVYINTFKSYPETLVGIFDNISEKDYDMIGFIIFSTFIKTYISSNYNVWLFIIAVISGICIVSTLYKYSKNFAISVFLFMASCQFTWMFNGMRQFLAVSILFASTPLIINKKTMQYFFVVILASTIHITSIIMIPIYFIVRGEPWNKKTIGMIIILLICILFSNEFFQIFDSMMKESQYAIGYEEFKKTDDGVNIMTIIIQSIPLIIAYIFRFKLKYKYTPIIKLCINMNIISVCIYIISRIVKSGVLIGRVPIYFTLYNLILLPWILSNSFEKKEKRLIYYVMVISYLILFYYQLVISGGGWIYTSQVLNI